MQINDIIWIGLDVETRGMDSMDEIKMYKNNWKVALEIKHVVLNDVVVIHSMIVWYHFVVISIWIHIFGRTIH